MCPDVGVEKRVHRRMASDEEVDESYAGEQKVVKGVRKREREGKRKRASESESERGGKRAIVNDEGKRGERE